MSKTQIEVKTENDIHLHTKKYTEVSKMCRRTVEFGECTN